jgi:hypothetical protein
MSGRDPGEKHRASTPLELLFDLTFVVAVARAGDELRRALVDGAGCSKHGRIAASPPSDSLSLPAALTLAAAAVAPFLTLLASILIMVVLVALLLACPGLAPRTRDREGCCNVQIGTPWSVHLSPWT